VTDDDLARERADEALRFALAHNYSNHIIRPLLAATHGGNAHVHQGFCPVHGVETGASMLVVNDPVEAQEWNRPDDAYLESMLEKMRFEAHLNEHYRRGGR